MEEIVANIEISEDVFEYTNYLQDNWPLSFLQAEGEYNKIFNQLVHEFVLNWRTVSYIASMPYIFCAGLQSSLDGALNSSIKDSAIVFLATQVTSALASKIPELTDDLALCRDIKKELAIIGDNIKECKEKIEISTNEIWKDMLEVKPFKMTVWASQRTAFVSFFNAYESFLIGCVKRILEIQRLRTSDRGFLDTFRSAFKNDISNICWSNQELVIAREVRHSLTHGNGKPTANLNSMKHRFKLIDGVLQIFPKDVHALIRRLMLGVEAMIENKIR